MEQRLVGSWNKLFKFSVYFLSIFNTLLCILFLSLGFSSACPLLTLLQLRYILSCFIVYFRIISVDLTCAFQSGVYDFYGCLCISCAPFLVMIFLIIAPYPYVFTHIIWDLLGCISESNMFALIFFTLFFLYFSWAYGRTLFYKTGATSYLA